MVEEVGPEPPATSRSATASSSPSTSPAATAGCANAAVRPVRDHPGPLRGQGRDAVRLHVAVRLGSRRAGRVPPRPAGPVRADQDPGRHAGRAVPVPLRRAADRVAGRGLRRHPRRRQRRRFRARPDRPDVRADRPAPRRRPGHRHRLRARAACTGRAVRRRTDRTWTTSTTSSAALHRSGRRARPRLDDRRRRHGGSRRRARQPASPRSGQKATGLLPDPIAQKITDKVAVDRLDALLARDQGRAPRRHRLDQRRLRRRGRPAADDGDVRPRHPAAHGPGPRAALDRRHPSARPRPGRPARHAGSRRRTTSRWPTRRRRTRCSATRRTAASRWCCNRDRLRSHGGRLRRVQRDRAGRGAADLRRRRPACCSPRGTRARWPAPPSQCRAAGAVDVRTALDRRPRQRPGGCRARCCRRRLRPAGRGRAHRHGDGVRTDRTTAHRCVPRGRRHRRARHLPHRARGAARSCAGRAAGRSWS